MKEKSAKSRIIEATITCIEKFGIESVTIRAIAKEAGVTLSSVHYYYHSKEALLRSAVLAAISGAINDLNDIWEGGFADVLCAVSSMLNYLFDRAIKFPGVTKAGLYPMIMHNDTNSYFISELNALLDKISGEVAKKLNTDIGEAKAGLVEMFSSILLLGMSPGSFGSVLGYDFYDEKSRRLYTDAAIRKLRQT